MRLPIFVLLLGVGFIATAIALRLGLRSSREPDVEFATGLAGGAGVVWLLVTIAAFNVVTVSGGSEIANSYPSLGALGVIGVAVSVLIFGKGSLELLNT